MFRILLKGYLTTIIESNTKLNTIKQENLIVIDEIVYDDKYRFMCY
jgi:hypothetical protein